MWPTPAIVWDPWRCPPITRHVRRHNAKKLVQNEVFSHDLQCVEYGPRKLQKTQFSLVPRLCLDDSTQTKPPACPHGVGGWSPRCRIAWNGLHHPRESILAPIDVLGNLDLKNVWWILVLNVWENFELQSDCFERQRKVAQSARWGYATTPKIPHRTFLRNGFEDIVCGIHPRELLQIQIWSIQETVSLARSRVQLY